MKSKFLVQKYNINSKYVLNCSVLDEDIICNNEEEANDLLRNKLIQFLKTHGREWIDQFKSEINSEGSNLVNCPDATILLPLDAWHCKHDNMPCGLMINIDNEKDFLENCRAKQKNGIFQSVKNKKFEGFHHVPGRYLCPLCEKKIKENKQNFRYHYPWELYPLSDCIDFETEDAFWILRESGLSTSIGYAKVCGPCFVGVVEKFHPSDPIPLGLFVVEVDFYPR